MIQFETLAGEAGNYGNRKILKMGGKIAMTRTQANKLTCFTVPKLTRVADTSAQLYRMPPPPKKKIMQDVKLDVHREGKFVLLPQAKGKDGRNSSLGPFQQPQEHGWNDVSHCNFKYGRSSIERRK